MKVVLENLTKKFQNRNRKDKKDVIAVDDFNLEIPDGKLVGLLGPSGCGKSTLLRHLKPDLSPHGVLSGEIFFEEEMYKEAISVYMSALRYNPGSYDLYYSLGMAYTMINDFQRAKEFYSKAAEINTLAYNAKLNLGQIALIYGDLDEAEQWFIQAGKQEDIEAGSYYYLSQIALLKGDEDKAKNYMNVAVQLDPKVYKQAQRDPVFTPIKEKINPPEENKENEKNKTLSKKEKSVNRHLMKTCILVKNLSKEDIRNAKANRQNEIDIDEKQKE